MLILLVVFTAICVAVTFSVLDQLVKACVSMPKHVGELAFRFLSSTIIVVLLNVTISYLIVAFTGAGMLAGMANLGSSIVAGVFGPQWMRKRYEARRDGTFRSKTEWVRCVKGNLITKIKEKMQ